MAAVPTHGRTRPRTIGRTHRIEQTGECHAQRHPVVLPATVFFLALRRQVAHESPCFGRTAREAENRDIDQADFLLGRHLGDFFIEQFLRFLNAFVGAFANRHAGSSAGVADVGIGVPTPGM